MKKNGSGTAVAAARSAVEGKIGVEAASRAGRNPNLKGIVHEVMVKDRYNADPLRLLDDSKAVLAKSPTAVRDDVLIMRDGRVVGRMQLKDASKSARDIVRRVQNKQYAGTRLCGTEETVQAYDRCAAAVRGKPVTQKMTSTGISSDDTARVAIQTIGDSAGKLSAQMMGKVAVSSGVAGAAVSGGIAALASGVQLLEGDIDGSEFAGNVADAAVKGGLSAAGASAAGTAAAAGVATVLAGTTAPLWAPAAVGAAAALGVGTAIAGGLEEVVGDSIGDVVSGVVDTVGDTLEDARFTACAVAEGVADTVGDVFEDVGLAFGGIADSIADGVRDLFWWL